MNPELNLEIRTSNLSAIDRLALRCAIASLDLLKQAAQDLGVTMDVLTPEMLFEWLDENVGFVGQL
jgi:hypothetical protein